MKAALFSCSLLALLVKGALCTVYVCDTGVDTVKLVSPISPFVRYMETVNSMTRVFGIHHKFPAGLQDAIKSLNDKTVAQLHEASAQASTCWMSHWDSVTAGSSWGPFL